jgi:hypothetical protein
MSHQWTDAEDAHLLAMRSAGVTHRASGALIGKTIGQAKARLGTLDERRKRAGEPVQRPEPSPATPPFPTSKVEGNDREQTITFGIGRVTNLDQLLAATQVDLTKWKVDHYLVNTWEVGSKLPTGLIATETLYQVKAFLKSLEGVIDQPTVEAAVEAAAAKVNAIPYIIIRRTPLNLHGILQVLAVADAHVGKDSKPMETGAGEWSLDTASRVVRDGSLDALERGSAQGASERLIAFLGDNIHVEGLSGATTAGTRQDYNARPYEMVDVFFEAAVPVIDRAASEGPTSIIYVPGNHARWTEQMIMRMFQQRFRLNPHVKILRSAAPQQYFQHGRVLLGLAHGDGVKLDALPLLMAQDRPREWGETVYREWLTGDKHEARTRDTKLVRKDTVKTTMGVQVRIIQAPPPPDIWHAHQGYKGHPLAVPVIESHMYHPAGLHCGSVKGWVQLADFDAGNILKSA